MALGFAPSDRLLRLLGGPQRRRLAGGRLMVRRVLARDGRLRDVDDSALHEAGLALQYRARSGEPMRRLLPEVFALVRRAAARRLGLEHYPVQLLGGAALCSGAIVEMETGEGKTLTATLPAALHALTGRGVHVATVNDYLAERDAEWMRPVYEALGLSVGYVVSGMPPTDRRAAYACDVTYGTAREFGFDFLRDRLAERRGAAEGSFALIAGVQHASRAVQRQAAFALVDEADSLLVDEARMPLIISSSSEAPDSQRAAEWYRWAASVAPRFEEGTHYEYEAGALLELTAAGRRLVRTSETAGVESAGLVTLYEYVERAIRVAREFQRDRHYVVRDGEIVIVDEFTGRLAEGRKWRGGIHQAVEAKEGLEVVVGSGQAAQITMQELFRRYEHLAGMTGTARSAAREFRGVYGLPVVPVPTHRRSRRVRWPTRIYATSAAKWQAIVEEVVDVHAEGRPVLVGTRSIDRSKRLSGLLADHGLEHQVLNALEHEREAEIVAAAGLPGRVTVATNMAGRGTDIALDPDVVEAGGLHVIGSEFHESARIDRQLFGRCARQGDPGTYRQFASLEDDVLLLAFGAERVEELQGSARSADDRCDHLRRVFGRAQARLEREHARQRRLLLRQFERREESHRRLGLDPYVDTPED